MKHILLSWALPLALSTAAMAEDCVTVKLEENSPQSISAKKLCVGDEVFSVQTKQMARITEIDKSAQEFDKKAAALFLIKDTNGKSMRVVDEEVVISNKTLCMTNAHNLKACVGDKYIDIDSGKEQTITGFTLPTEKKPYADALVKNADGAYEKDNTYDVFNSVKATQTGLIFAVGSCAEGMLPSFESSLKKCALKNMAKAIEESCSKFTQGKGKAVYDLSSKDIKLECRKDYSMIGTSTKTCTADADLKCERVANLKDTAKMLMDANGSLNAGTAEGENKVSDSSRGQVKDVQHDSEKERSSTGAAISK